MWHAKAKISTLPLDFETNVKAWSVFLLVSIRSSTMNITERKIQKTGLSELETLSNNSLTAWINQKYSFDERELRGAFLWAKLILAFQNFLISLVLCFKPFRANVSFLYPLKTSKNLLFSDVFKEYRNGTLSWMS